MSRRIRSLKPEILEDEKTAGMSDTAFRIFVGLITMADDFGSFRADPRLLESAIYWVAVPERAVDIALRELGDTGIVEFYTVRGQRYGRFRNWAKHQRVDNVPKERRSGLLPAPEDGDPVVSFGPRGGSESQLLSPPRDENLTSESAARARAPDRIGSDRIGEEKRAAQPPHCTPPPADAESQTRIVAAKDLDKGDPHAPTDKLVPETGVSPRGLRPLNEPPEPEPSGDQVAIALQIRQHAVFRKLDAHGIASHAVTGMIGKGTRLAWVTQAIDDCAGKCVGLGLTAEALQSKLVGFMRHAKPPKADEREQKSGPAYREEQEDPAVIERIRRMPKRVTAQDTPPPVSTEATMARGLELMAKLGTGGT